MSATKLTHATLEASTGESLTCQINPETIRRCKSAVWTQQSTQASPQPTPQYIGSGPDSLSATLLFDNRKAGASDRVTWTSIGRLLGWLNVPKDARSHATPQPPKVTFKWGGSTGFSFGGYLNQVTVNYTMFSPDGQPIRATAAISITAMADDPQGTNPTSGGVSGRASAQLCDGDTLASIAYQHYGDPNLWRAIAAVNGIEDPARVPIGSRLQMPPRTEAHALTRLGSGHA